MATIIDVARMAGVSQGTASNVLNGKGNVSSEKIKAVEEAAKKLGYTINERAKMLRKGSGNIICVIVPSMERRHYRDFYYCLKSYAEKRGYTAELLITNDNRQTEYSMIQWAKSVMAMGVASITCLGEKEVKEAYAGFEKLCFVERKATDDLDYIGFDYESAGGQIAETVISARYHNVLVVTDSLKFSNENEFCRGLYKMLAQEKIKFFHITTDSRRVSHAIINTLVQENEYDAIITTNIRFAEKIRNVVTNFSAGNQTPIFTLSPITSLPEKDYRKYEVNYGLVGKMAAEKIIGDSKENGAEKELICENDGFREWNQITLNKTPADHLRILTLDSPETMILQGLAKLYTEETGTQIQFDVFSYDDIYEQFMKAENSDYYDIFRMDVTWLPLLSERILVPLDDMTPDIDEVYKEYIPALIDKYSRVHGKAYALPITPSTQLLFYRKDLLELSPEDRSHEGIFLSFQYPVEIPGVSMVNFMRAAVNEQRKYKGLPALTASEFLKLMREKRAVVELDNKLANRSVNEGFSGGEKKRNEIFQMAMLEPRLSILDETDSGLDIDALRIVAEGVNKLKTPETSTIVITHYQRLLDYIKPDIVHVLYKGRIVKTAGPELALELEEKGYDWIKKEVGE